jgi:peroxiredoxin
VVSGDSLKLSAFDGSHAFLFTAKIDNENKISGGKFYSGARGIQNWSAERNAEAALPDEFSGTKIKPGSGKLNFSFPDMNDGRLVSINDQRFKNKVIVITIMGSWCPNCMDETKFLSEYYKENHQRGVEIIGLAYERTADFKSSQKALQSFKKRFGVTYPMLITGVTVSDSLRTEKTLPQLEKIEAFPTTIFVDKGGNIRKVHSGFNGPATGEHYTEFKKEFDEIMNQLLAEK